MSPISSQHQLTLRQQALAQMLLPKLQTHGKAYPMTYSIIQARLIQSETTMKIRTIEDQHEGHVVNIQIS